MNETLTIEVAPHEKRTGTFYEIAGWIRVQIQKLREQKVSELRLRIFVGYQLLQVSQWVGGRRGIWASFYAALGMNRHTARRCVKVAAAIGTRQGELDAEKLKAAVDAWNLHHPEELIDANDADAMSIREAERICGYQTNISVICSKTGAYVRKEPNDVVLVGGEDDDGDADLADIDIDDDSNVDDGRDSQTNTSVICSKTGTYVRIEPNEVSQDRQGPQTDTSVICSKTGAYVRNEPNSAGGVDELADPDQWDDAAGLGETAGADDADVCLEAAPGRELREPRAGRSAIPAGAATDQRNLPMRQLSLGDVYDAVERARTRAVAIVKSGTASVAAAVMDLTAEYERRLDEIEGRGGDVIGGAA